MEIEELVNKAKAQDARNTFEPYKGDVSGIPQEITDLFLIANPVDVEIRTRKFGNIRFYPIQEIPLLRREYSFMPEDSFIFASSNGDPFFIKDGNYFTTIESRFQPEFIAGSLSEFLDVIKIK